MRQPNAQTQQRGKFGVGTCWRPLRNLPERETFASLGASEVARERWKEHAGAAECCCGRGGGRSSGGGSAQGRPQQQQQQPEERRGVASLGLSLPVGAATLCWRTPLSCLSLRTRSHSRGLLLQLVGHFRFPSLIPLRAASVSHCHTQLAYHQFYFHFFVAVS